MKTFSLFLAGLLAAVSFSAFAVVGDRTFYQILGVSESADQEAMQQAWKKKRFETHPDRNRSPFAAEEFHHLNAAYETLKSPLERSNYDKQLDRFRRAGRIPPAKEEREEKTDHSINQQIDQAVLSAMEELNKALNDQGGKGSPAFLTRREVVDRRLGKALEAVFLNAGANVSETGDPLVVPEEVLSFPQSLSFLLERGALAAFAPSGKKSALERALVLENEPSALREILRHNKNYINRKSSKGTPFFSLVLKRIRHSLNEGREGDAQAWQDLADEILNGGVLDLSLQDAKGATVLETAVTHRLNKTAARIYFIRQGAGDIKLESESRERLMPAAEKAGNVQMIEFLKTGAEFENALTDFIKEKGKGKMTASEKAELRKALLGIGIVLGGSAFGLYLESGAESDWPLWLRSLPWTAASFVPAHLMFRNIDREKLKRGSQRVWEESLKGEEAAARARIKAGIKKSVRLAAEALRRAGVKLTEIEIKEATARIAASASEALKKIRSASPTQGGPHLEETKISRDISASADAAGALCGGVIGSLGGLFVCNEILGSPVSPENMSLETLASLALSFQGMALSAAGSLAGIIYGGKAARKAGDFCYKSFAAFRRNGKAMIQK